MNITHSKKVIDQMHRCYSVSPINFNNEKAYIVASEAIDGEAKFYYGENYQNSEVIWGSKGGTMSIVPIPDSDQVEFLSVQNFFPGFNARKAKIVHIKYVNSQWKEQDVIEIPYCHRFELIKWNNEIYIVTATLCAWKNEREDWTSPGHVSVGKYNTDTRTVTDYKLLIPNLTQNHGMLKIERNGDDSTILVSTYDGVFEIYFDKKEKIYNYRKILDEASSETLIVDIDNDGEDEFIIIEQFHGNELGIYSLNGELKKKIQRNTNFLHALWSGVVKGIPMYICGGRRIDSDIYLGYFDQEKKEYKEYIIDSGNGSANISVSVNEGSIEILSANNSLDEIAIYNIEVE